MDDRLPGPGRRTMLRGRGTECAFLDALVAAIPSGESRSLVLRGEAGIGKTALLDHLAGSASEMTVVRAAGVQSEMTLAFATLHQLCGPLLDRLERVPAPQRQALEVVFGIREGAPPDRFLVGLAVLSLFSEAAEERPLLCVVDDAQWVDQESALTLAFVARRLQAERVGIVFAAREPGEELRHLAQLEVRGLGDDDARALLASEMPSMLDERVRDQVIAETRGNPLALLELPRGMSEGQLAGGFGLHGPGPAHGHPGDDAGAHALTGRIEDSFVRRLDGLSGDARRLLLVAAAEPVGDPLLLLGASERLGIAVSAVDSETEGLLGMDERVTFRHPLVRSAVYRSAALQDRREVHTALAEATDREADPDRRAWHLAAAAAGLDEDVALELERSAGRAQARGGFAAAAAFLQRAVALTGDPARRAERALAAAQASLGAGAFDVARGLLAVAEAGPLDELGRARLDLLRGELAFAQNRGSEAPALLLGAAQKLEGLDPRLCRDTYLDAWGAALFACHLASASLTEVSSAVKTAPPPDRRLPRDELLDGLAQVFTDGRHAAEPALRRSVSLFAGTEASDEELMRWGWLASRAANFLWDNQRSFEIASRAVQLARDTGALETLALADNTAGQAAVFGGDFATCTVLAAEIDSVKEATGTRVPSLAALSVAGIRGHEAEATALFQEIIAAATAAGQGAALLYAHWSNAVLLNGLGRYEEAMAAASEATKGVPELYVAWWALSELVEAAARTENTDRAERGVELLGEAVQGSGSGWPLGVHARARALLSRGEAAERLYGEAIDHLERTHLRPELARTHLLYGEWLRRESRRVDARNQLRRAHGMFGEIGMDAFAERARRELQATGEKVRTRTVETRDELTAQERQIAGLARDGLSNPEIGARLFLSPRTVEWHLRKVYSKLDIRSRRDLAAALPDSGSLIPG